MNPPPNLEALRLIPNPAQRAKAAKAYVAERQAAIDAARKIRDQAIAVLIGQGAKPDEIAAACDVSVAHVKLVKRIAAANA